MDSKTVKALDKMLARFEREYEKARETAGEIREVIRHHYAKKEDDGIRPDAPKN